ncbi:hypothetical protein FNJ84_13425 [Paracoccus sp. M683]|uniref:hypothetical protein n=1 Tax=Paracoccus sp. M683 TaxID=2594268 RepID=UPI00117BF3DA|nr:hypothetical protein [Paracoccus sp. M683]TRW96280.1 hypothetical protein FNJ84_13425 [Paracoccus sp. M683]
MRYQKLVLSLFIVVVSLLIGTADVISSEPESDPYTDWKLAKNEALQALNSGKCEKTWIILLDAARSDIPEIAYDARRTLYNSIMPDSGKFRMIPPGILKDEFSILEHATIIATHSNPTLIKNNKTPAVSLLKARLPKSRYSDRYLECISTSKMDNCANILVQSETMPSFGDYSREVQTLWHSGLRSSCANN